MDKKLKNYIVQLVLRRGTMKWRPRSNALKKARRELPRKINKDGSKSKKAEFEYQCAICKEWFRGGKVQADHIESIIKLDSSQAEMSLDEIVERMYCSEEGYQILCAPEKGKGCHAIKTDLENKLRSEYKEKKSERENTIECMTILKEFNKKGKKK